MFDKLAGDDRVETVRRQRQSMGEPANFNVVHLRVERIYAFWDAVNAGNAQGWAEGLHDSAASPRVASDIQHVACIGWKMTNKLLIPSLGERVSFADFLFPVERNNDFEAGQGILLRSGIFRVVQGLEMTSPEKSRA